MTMSTICGCGRAMNPLIIDFELFRGGLSAKAAASCRKPVEREPNMCLPGPDDGITAEEVADALLAAIVPCNPLTARQRQEGFVDGEWPEAIQLLVAACVQLLWDWFPEHDWTCKGLSTLLSMDEFKAHTDFESPLDLVFKQIETGRHYVKRECAAANDEWVYVPTDMERADGAKPAERKRPDGCCGMAPEEDAALGFYARFKNLAIKSPLQTRAEVIRVHDAFAWSLEEKEIAPEQAVREYLRTKESIMDYRVQVAGKTPEINAFERLYVASLKLAIEAANTSDSARAAYRQMLESELTELASADGREA